ncbi:MAG: ABC transporter ATP-binding protein [Clostridia bacterium]|nr:ABC transporter ATP-binding protein [Clostridia bacterium]
MIILQDIKRSYDGRLVLDVPYCEFEDGKSYFIKGESGTGKTTLFNLISGLALPEEGIVQVGDDMVQCMTERQRDAFRAQNVGYVFQDFNLFDGFTALENVLVPIAFVEQKARAKEAKARAMDALGKVGLADKSGVKVNKLSGGEKQRVAIARALVNVPKVLLADEPTGNLDKRNSAHIMDLLIDSARACGATLLVVSHDLSLAEKFDVVLDISDVNRQEEA